MPYFSRLTDIVTCNLSSILAREEDPSSALQEIIREMTEGVAGAERSVKTAGKSVADIEGEIAAQRTEIANWVAHAQRALSDGNENDARHALQRKYEIEDLIAGLEQQLQAAVSTRDHLQTMRSALEARLADARRRLSGMQIPSEPGSGEVTSPAPSARQSRLEEDLAALKRQLDTES